MVGLSSLLVSMKYFIFFYGVGTGNENIEGKYDKNMNLLITKKTEHMIIYTCITVYTCTQSSNIKNKKINEQKSRTHKYHFYFED